MPGAEAGGSVEHLVAVDIATINPFDGNHQPGTFLNCLLAVNGIQ